MLKKSISLLLVCILIITLVFTGCTTKTDSRQVGEEAGDMKRDDIVIGMAGMLNLADPHNTYGMDPSYLIQIYEPLINIDSDNNMTPCLAEKWEISDDGKEYTFYLKEGVKFHNGYDFTAKDVKFSFERAASSPYTSMAYEAMDSIEVVDDYTVKVYLKYSYAPFIYWLTTFCGLIVSEEYVTEVGEEFGKIAETAIGTGAYILKEWNIGESVTMERFDGYHKGPATIKTIKYKAFSEGSSAVIALETGEIDFYKDIPIVDINTVKNNTNLEFEEMSSLMYYYLAPNMSSDLFSNTTLRKALAYAINREDVYLVAAEGSGIIANSPISENLFGTPDNIPEWYEYNPDKARRLLAEAGYPNGLDISIKIVQEYNIPKIAQVIQDNLSKIGINAEITILEMSTFISEVASDGDYEMTIMIFGGLVPDADVLFLHFHESCFGTSGNFIRYIDPEMNRLLEQGRMEMDTAKRKEIYKNVIEKSHDEVLQIPLYFPLSNVTYNKDLKGMKIKMSHEYLIFNLSW